jgi:hypothetical protein
MAWLVIINGNHLLTEQQVKEIIMGAVQDVIDQVTEQLGRAKDEILAKVADLEAQVAAGETPDLEPLKAAAQALDDVVPDTPAEESVEPGE